MDISYIPKSQKPVDNLTTKEPHIVHVIPDFKSNIINYIKTSLGIRPNSISSIVSKTGIVKIAGKSFNSKKYTDQLNLLLKQRKININMKIKLPRKIPRSKFTVIDHSIISQAIGYVNELASPKQALYFLFQKIKSEMQAIKKEHPEVKQTVLFSLNKYENGMIELLDYMKQVPKQDLNTDYNIFDDVCVVSIAVNDKKTSVVPIMGYDSRGNIELYKNNIGKIKTALKKIEKTQINQVAVEKAYTRNQKLSQISNKIEKEAKKEELKKNKDGFYEPVIEINQKKLNNILKGYKIKDLTVASNIKESVNKYLIDNKEIYPNSFESKEELEQVILKSIHFSLFQTDEIREEYLHDPGALIKKLIDVNSHSKDLEIPQNTQTQLIDPQNIVDLKTVNSVRHEYELDENIHNNIKDLFKSLEEKKNAPIKIMNVKHEYKDDNMNRYIEYTVKMKNLTGGNKYPYEIKMKIPSLVNNRYLKLNGSEYILLSQQYLTPLNE